jgi:hypothetical protein
VKFKVVPEPRGVDFIRDAQRALPLVPGNEDDCCARLMNRTDLSARDDAREWITFLRALRLAEETDSGFRRLRRDPETTDLADAFRERVFGADTVLEILTAADEPLGVDTVFEQFRDRVPNWERYRRGDWEDEWRERVRRLLGWTVVFDLTERSDERYRAT